MAGVGRGASERRVKRAPSTGGKLSLGGGDHKRITHQGHVKGLSDPLGRS